MTNTKKAEKFLGRCGTCFGSKTTYRFNNPFNVVVFNANVCTKTAGKIWHGDLDITKSLPKLKKLAKELNEQIYVIYEMGARFETESEPQFEKATVAIHSHGGVIYDENEFKKSGEGFLQRHNLEGIVEENVLQVIPLDIIQFDNNKKKTPLEQFYDYIKKNCKTELTHCDEVVISNQDNEHLEYQLMKWARREGIGQAKALQSASMTMFANGPSVNQKAKTNMVYIVKRKND